LGAFKVGLCERRAKPAKIIDDEVIVFGPGTIEGHSRITQLPCIARAYTDKG